MSSPSVADLTRALREFARERDWEKFHAPKNLAMGLVIEAAEVAEHFQWLEPGESAALPEATKAQVAHEIGDTLLYLLRLADVLGIDPLAAAAAKMRINAERYPIDKAYGRATKYDAL